MTTALWIVTSIALVLVVQLLARRARQRGTTDPRVSTAWLNEHLRERRE